MHQRGDGAGGERLLDAVQVRAARAVRECRMQLKYVIADVGIYSRQLCSTPANLRPLPITQTHALLARRYASLVASPPVARESSSKQGGAGDIHSIEHFQTLSGALVFSDGSYSSVAAGFGALGETGGKENEDKEFWKQRLGDRWALN